MGKLDELKDEWGNLDELKEELNKLGKMGELDEFFFLAHLSRQAHKVSLQYTLTLASVVVVVVVVVNNV